MAKKLIAFSLVLISVFCLCSCSGEYFTEARKVNKQMNYEADSFGCERRITVYNARTDKQILYIEGYMSLSNNSSNELVITCKTGANEYKKNYVYLTDWVMYTMEDISGTHADPYHYKFYFSVTPPEIEIVP